ncbi:unnamed protein product [Somion occarium]|uniref:Copper transport protein n=1 Tax=Somion occarium TaxID=3059160 RepID=A0ABP1DF22_9APHY
MDHGDHGGHGGHEMPSMPTRRCSMNMLWNTQIEDTCIVFRSWHISSTTAFVFSCLIVVALGVLYEWLRRAQSNLDVKIAASLSAQGKGKGRSGEHTGTTVPLTARLTRAFLYGLTVFLSFFLMLVFMTYNAYLILAVVVGAAIGHFVFNPQMDVEGILAGSSASGKGMACH